MSENLDRRVLAGFRCIDAITSRSVLQPLSVTAPQLALRRNHSGIFAVVDAPGFTALTKQFLAPAVSSWPPPVSTFRNHDSGSGAAVSATAREHRCAAAFTSRASAPGYHHGRPDDDYIRAGDHHLGGADNHLAGGTAAHSYTEHAAGCCALSDHGGCDGAKLGRGSRFGIEQCGACGAAAMGGCEGHRAGQSAGSGSDQSEWRSFACRAGPRLEPKFQ